MLVNRISCLHSLGIYFFTKGFLLTRLVLDYKSECTTSPIQLQSKAPGTHLEGCWHPKTFDKAIVIIIDALRYDFTVPHDDRSHHFHNALSIFHETAVQNPHNAILLPFIADPPTTTLQRLKGLTTGTLPTFIDAGSNFGGTAIEEDNLIAQLRDAGKTMVHLGDDTWHSLFPGYFNANLTHAYDSFNVWDLHTVDNGVSEHLLPLLNPSNTSKWDIIFGHYLGVDHAGHRYGPDHPAMSAKLNQMDSVVREIITLLDDKTLLIVMGDHGMDTKGDHGGESDDEVEAALWMFSKKGVFGRDTIESRLPPRTAKERPVGQIDLVPTLALLLGLPIPYNNLGAPITEAFIGRSGSNWKNLASVNALAAAQVDRYLERYSVARGLENHIVTGPKTLWTKASSIWAEIVKHKANDVDQYRDVCRAFSEYQIETLRICRGLWARFDVVSMLAGIAILLSALMVLMFYARCVRGDISRMTPALLRSVAQYSVVGAFGGICFTLILPAASKVDTILSSTAAGGIVGAAFVFIGLQRGLLTFFPLSLWGYLAVVLTLSQAIGFASNSYTIWEDEILLFFIGTFAATTFVSSMRRSEAIHMSLGAYQSVVFLVLTRFASLSRLCREEQMPYCRSTYYASATSSTSALWQLLIPFVAAIILPSVIKVYYSKTQSYEGPATGWIGIVLRLGLLSTAIFWILDAADDGDWFSLKISTLKNLKTFIAQLVLGVAFVPGSGAFIFSKPCIAIDEPAMSTQKGSTITSTIDPGKSITVLGYCNMHGSRYFLLVCNMILAIAMVQKPMGGGAISVLAWQVLALLEIVDANNISQSAIGPVVLGLLGSFHFFKTGHQATLSSIQWESAFISMETIRYPWSPMLVILNTFGAQILATVAVPLLVLWKQTPRKQGLLGAVARAMATYLLYYAVINVATTMWAGWLRRHLMLYRIFSPRFMAGAAVLLTVDLVGILIALVAVRWNFMSVAQVFGWP